MPDVAQVIDQARQITGNSADNAVGETFIPDGVIQTALAPAIRDLNALYGNAASLKERTFQATPRVQDYPIAASVGEDVYDIVDVIRSGAFVPEGIGEGDDGLAGSAVIGGGGIPSGLQADATEAIVSQWRRRVADRFAWEVVNDQTLRLMPTPATAEWVCVRYVSDGFTSGTLPAATEPALVAAACVAILNGIINRINSDRQTADTYGQAKTERLKMLVGQRDYYQKQADRELSRLAGHQ